MKSSIHKTLGLRILGMAQLIICIFLLFTTIGCSNSRVTFKHDEWIRANDEFLYERKKMAVDLVDSKMLVGISKQEVIELLGAAENFSESDKLYYTIEIDYGSDIDPVKIEYLVVSLGSEEQVSSVFIEIKHNK